MIIGAARIDLRIEGARSLKEKRQVLRSLLDRARRSGVAVAEVGDHDLWNVATVGLSAVGAQTEHVRELVRRAADIFESASEATVESLEMDIFHFGPE